MESALMKLKSDLVRSALALTGIQVDNYTAAVLQDVILKLQEKGADFSIEDALNINHANKSELQDVSKYNKIVELKERYRVLSELHDSKSKHKLQVHIGEEMKKVLEELKHLNVKA